MAGRDLDIEHLARRAAAGDAAAFEEMCAAVADDVWRYCYAILRDRERAFDAAQDTFVRATTAISRFRGDAPVKAWLMVIARRAVADMLRKDDRRRDRISLMPDPDAQRSSDADAVLIEQLIDELTPDRRQAFVLTQLVGLSYDEAAAVADVAVGTIRSRVSRARKDLAEALREPEGRPDRPTQ